MTSMETSNLTKDYLRKLFSEGKRFDSRGLLDYRALEISYEVSNKAEGSARVKLGKTEVVVGVKLAPGEPYPDSPDKGNLIVSGDLLPLASPRFESGPPKFPAIELPRLVDRIIRESRMIELSKLAISEEKVWTVFIDIYPINDDGNLIDASSIAAVAALKNAVIPNLDKSGNPDYETKSRKKLPLDKNISPVSFTFYKLGDSIIMDPTREEEEACDVKITFGVSHNGKEHLINSCQKSGEIPLSQEEIEKILDLLPKKFDEIYKKLEKQLE